MCKLIEVIRIYKKFDVIFEVLKVLIWWILVNDKLILIVVEIMIN